MLAQRVRQRSGELPGRVLSGGTQAMDGDSAYKSFLPPASPWVKVMVTVDRPPAESLAQHNRREKIQILEENARQHRAGLVQWIEEHGFSEDVAVIGAPNSMNLFFIECTPEVAQALIHAPGVIRVAPAVELH
jgi:hypothetical protein